MSLVEKALEKLRAAASHEPASPPVRRIGPDAATNGSSAAGPELSRRVLRFDHETLIAAGVLAPASEANRAASEYRLIKRAVISDAYGAHQQRGAHDSRVVAITSAVAGDGKTHTSVNLALSVARERDHVAVLVDADIAKADVTQLLGLGDEPGLLDALASDDLDVRTLLRPTDQPNLWVLPTGRRSELSLELLGAERLTAICSRILATLPGAVLLLDSPPLLQTSEAHVLTSVAGQVLLVVKAGVTVQQAVTDAIARVGDPKRIRLVLNQADIPARSAYYYGNYGQ